MRLARLKQKVVFFITLFFISHIIFSQTAEEAAEHAQRKAPTFFDFLFNSQFITKYYTMLILGIIVLVLLLTKKMNTKLKISILLISTFLFGYAGNIPVKPFSFFTMHPSPMCVTKALLYGFAAPFVFTLGIILLLTLIGPRLFCGYICPVGALQELIAVISGKLKIKRKNFNFIFAHTVRLTIFILFIFLSITMVLHVVFAGETYAQSLYDYVNVFHGMEIGMPGTFGAALTHYLPFILTVILAAKYYRPFCHFVCPVGLFTHWAEQVSLFKVSLKRSKCTDCMVCVKQAPCKAMDDILKESLLRPDCYACNICVAECPEDALDFGIRRTKKG